MKSNQQKKLLIEQLKKTPIVQFATEKVGISRATYYRWRKENKKFAKDADIALSEGLLLINDMAESQLISAIRDKNMTGIIYWLRHHHPQYNNRLEISGRLNIDDEQLTPEQKALIKKALKLADFDNNNVVKNDYDS